MTFLDLVQYARVLLAGILVFVIAYQLWVAYARRFRPILFATAAWTLAALAMTLGRFIQHETTDPVTVILGVRIFHTGLFAMVPLGFYLVHEIRRVPRGNLFRVSMAAGTIPIVLVWTGNLVVHEQVRSFQTLAGTILGPESATLGPLAIPYVVVVALYLRGVVRRGRQDLTWHERLPHQVVVYFFLPALVNDALLYAGTLVTIEMVGLALFAHVMAINVGIFVRVGELFAGLERTVDERTADLVSRERELSRMLSARRQMLDAIPATVCLLDRASFDYVNEAGTVFFGRSAEELIGSRFTDCVVPAQRGEAERCLGAIEEVPEPFTSTELVFVGPKGAERTGEVAGQVLELADGPRTLVTIRDVTERKRLLTTLQMADRLASVGTLASGVAHEINNPLTFVCGNLELMKRALAIDPGAAASDQGPNGLSRLVDECMIGAQRITRIVKDLRVFARADDEQAVLDVNAVLDQALKMAMVSVRGRADVVTDYGQVPPVGGDSRRLSQVFLNLLINASQAIPDGERGHTIRVATSRREDGWVLVSIADSGVGIDPKILGKVFDPFVTTKPVGTGTGLGLFICHGIVTALGGEIRLLPRPSGGTLAEVALPPAAASVAPVPEEARGDATPEFRRGVRVLLVDDEELVLQVLQRQLRGYTVTTVDGGAQAIERLEAGRYDVILCDLLMPGCNGIEVWKQAKRLGCEDRFVLMTGGATTEALRRFIERSAMRCLHKPVLVADVEAAIRDTVARQRERRVS